MNAYEAAKKAMVDLGMTKTKASYYLNAVICMGEKQAFEELTKGVLYDIQVRSDKEIASCFEELTKGVLYDIQVRFDKEIASCFEELTKGVLYDIQVRSDKEIASCSELADELKNLAEDAE